MPLRDHFHPPLSDRFPSNLVHRMWPMTIVENLNLELPAEYRAFPRASIGTSPEFPSAYLIGNGCESRMEGGAIVREFDLDEGDDFSTHVQYGCSTVAVIAIVGPRNVDTSAHRTAFSARCADLLGRGIAVAIVDILPDCEWDLTRETLAFLNAPVEDLPTSMKATSLRVRRGGRMPASEIRSYPLGVGVALPTIPVWIDTYSSTPLNLELSYESACKALHIP